MTVRVRPVDPHSDPQELLSVLQRNLPVLPHARRFQWLYRENPHGAAWSWFAYEKETDKIVGVTSVFPRAMWVGGEVKLCGQVGDFAIDVGHRCLGPAVLLQMTTFEPVQRGDLAFCYDCPPHEAGMSTFRRLGISESCQMHRYARPLRTDRMLEKRLGRAPWTRPVAAAGNLLLRLGRLRRRSVQGMEIAEHRGPFGEEFSVLDEQAARNDVIRGQRRAVDLNWRYRQDPLHEYRVLTARLRGEVIAFLILAVSGQDASVVDLFGLDLPAAGLALLEAALSKCGLESVQTVDACVSDGNDLRGVLEQAGFRRRSTAARVVVYAEPSSDVSVLLEKRRWSFNQAELLA